MNPSGAAAAAPTAAGGVPNIAAMQAQMMQNPEVMRSIMDSPMMQSLMNNPEVRMWLRRASLGVSVCTSLIDVCCVCMCSM